MSISTTTKKKRGKKYHGKAIALLCLDCLGFSFGSLSCNIWGVGSNFWAWMVSKVMVWKAILPATIKRILNLKEVKQFSFSSEVVWFHRWKTYFWCKGSMSSLQAARGISAPKPSKTEMIPYSLYSGWHKAPRKSVIPKTVRLMQQAAKSSSISITFFQTTTWTNLIEVTILANR